MTLHRPLIALMLAVGLAGCATTPSQCNPSNRDAGFLTKFSCDTSGAYRAGIDQKEQELVSAQEENQMFRQVYEDISQRQAASRQKLSEQKKKQAALDSSLGRLLNQLKAKHANNAQVQNELNDLQKKLKESQQIGTNQGNPEAIAAKQKELAALQKKVVMLQKSLDY
ncbi:hypothetical protein [Castellaniella sp.]|uniref:hypothetical protein n=1 Tax=Castellaniella sp. TaxID=1955812 RepID=UPI002AFEEA59|nr:hypothetical protein [Castellaniella sp.]